MTKYIIEGGHPLRGEVQINGAKNAALPMIAAALLTADECIFDNVPRIEDIRNLVEILRQLGCRIAWDESRHRMHISAANVTSFAPPVALATRMRGSFLIAGPLLARFGEARAPHPGGCDIGVRPVNVDVKGFTAMGARVDTEDAHYSFKVDRLRGQRIYLDYPSHTGTENLLMAACLAYGKTVIKNASPEPEVAALAGCLVRMGANITGAGTSVIEIDGVERLHGVHYRIMPDRIEAGTYAIAGAITGGDITLRDVIASHMDPLTYKLLEAGVGVIEGPGTYTVRAKLPLTAVEVQTLQYPGFPTDLQAAFAVLLTQAEGTSVLHERVYDNRLQYVGELLRMGADIQASGQTARIVGPRPLQGAHVRATDIRAGAALIIAGLAAEGVTEINDIHHVNRGYEGVDTKLNGLGARITRVEEEIQEAVV